MHELLLLLRSDLIAAINSPQVTRIIAALATYLIWRMNSQQLKTAADVKKTLAESNEAMIEDRTSRQHLYLATTDSIMRRMESLAEDSRKAAVVAMSTHSLVNKERGIILKKLMELAVDKADATGHENDINAADQAIRDYRVHEIQQGIVDSMPGTDAAKAGKHEPTAGEGT